MPWASSARAWPPLAEPERPGNKVVVKIPSSTIGATQRPVVDLGSLCIATMLAYRPTATVRMP